MIIVSRQSTLIPEFILAMGVLLVSVSFILILIGPTKHRKFAVWSAEKFKNTFRISGIAALIFGGFLIYHSGLIQWIF